MAAALRGRRWVSLEPGPWRPEYAPNLTFLASDEISSRNSQAGGETPFIIGTDGCNDLAWTGSIAGDRFEFSNVESTAVGCPAYAAGPQDAQRIRLSVDGTSFDLLENESVVATYAALDAMADATEMTAAGEWELTGGSPARLTLGGQGAIGSCSFAWTVAAGVLSADGLPTEPTACGADEGLLTLMPSLRGGLHAFLGGSGKDLYLAGGGTTLFHLTS